MELISLRDRASICVPTHYTLSEQTNRYISTFMVDGQGQVLGNSSGYFMGRALGSLQVIRLFVSVTFSTPKFKSHI